LRSGFRCCDRGAYIYDRSCFFGGGIVSKRKENIYRETFKEDASILTEQYLPKINGYTIKKGCILENGTDVINGKQEPYLIMKLYMQEDKK